jgi:hypothetical protein
VILHGRDHFLHLIRRHLQLVENDFHSFRAWMDVIAFVVPMRLADVVKQQGKEQQFRILQFIQQHRESMRGGKLFDIPDRDE